MFPNVFMEIDLKGDTSFCNFSFKEILDYRVQSRFAVYYQNKDPESPRCLSYYVDMYDVASWV